uniref:Secreted protein n=1 Tax=Panagrolaimus sp. JU765 TaxID=591449 RepID=A0AC34RGG8_9BILA
MISAFLFVFLTPFLPCHSHTEITDDYAIVHTYPGGYGSSQPSKRNCTKQNAIIDKLLNGTGVVPCEN